MSQAEETSQPLGSARPPAGIRVHGRPGERTVRGPRGRGGRAGGSLDLLACGAGWFVTLTFRCAFWGLAPVRKVRHT